MAALSGRGPDAQRTEILSSPAGWRVGIGFTRLRTQGGAGAEQPFVLHDGRRLLCNGEIYNAHHLGIRLPPQSSDCAIIPALLNRGDSLATVLSQLDGDFALTLVDVTNGIVQVARDPEGVRPLFFGSDVRHGQVALSSSIRAFPATFSKHHAVPPGMICDYSLATGRLLRSTAFTRKPVAVANPVEAAIVKRLATVRDIGICLTDSPASRVLADVVSRYLKTQGKPFYTYNIGRHPRNTVHEWHPVASLIRETAPSVAVVLLDVSTDPAASEAAFGELGIEARYPFLDPSINKERA